MRKCRYQPWSFYKIWKYKGQSDISIRIIRYQTLTFLRWRTKSYQAMCRILRKVVDRVDWSMCVPCKRRINKSLDLAIGKNTHVLTRNCHKKELKRWRIMKRMSTCHLSYRDASQQSWNSRMGFFFLQGGGGGYKEPFWAVLGEILKPILS